MTDHPQEDNELDNELTRADMKRIEEHLIDLVDSWSGQTPFRRQPDRPWRECEHRPDLKHRRLFPSVGYREANKLARNFEQAYGDLKRRPPLRLITLRLNRPRPRPDELEAHLDELVEAFANVCDKTRRANLRRQSTSPTPVLSAVHVRLSDEGEDRLDPHIHCMWEIADDNLSATRQRMEQAFGQVWIDPIRVQKPRQCAFYLCAGVVDYINIEAWPQAAVRAVWDLSGDSPRNGDDATRNVRRHRLIRRAGWFLRAGETPVGIEVDDAPLPLDGHSSRQENVVIQLDGANGAEPEEGQEFAQEGSENVNNRSVMYADWKTDLFEVFPPFKSSHWKLVTKDTVHKISTDKKNLLYYPNLGEMIAVAVIIIESEQRDFERRYKDVIDAYGFDEKQLDQAVAKVEAYFHLTLLHPGGQFIPTSEGVRWATVTYRSLEPLRDMINEGRGRVRQSVKDEGRLEKDLRRRRDG